MKISQQQALSFRRNGFLVVPGYFDRSETERLVGWIDELQSWPETPGAHMMYFEQSLVDEGRRILNRLENFVPYHEGIAEVLCGGRLVESVSTLFGEPAVLFKEKVNFKMPGGSGFEPHQDVQAGWEDYASLYITATVTIDETTLKNGCLQVANWRHRHEMIGELWKPLHDDELNDVTFSPYPSRPGDLMFFDSYLPHRSAPNLTSAPRRLLYVTYSPLSQGDHRARYYADKRLSYPPDCERDPEKVYEFRV